MPEKMPEMTLFPGDATFAKSFVKTMRSEDMKHILNVTFKPDKDREFVVMLLGDVPAGQAWVDVEPMLNELGYFYREPEVKQ